MGMDACRAVVPGSAVCPKDDAAQSRLHGRRGAVACSRHWSEYGDLQPCRCPDAAMAAGTRSTGADSAKDPDARGERNAARFLQASLASAAGILISDRPARRAESPLLAAYLSARRASAYRSSDVVASRVVKSDFHRFRFQTCLRYSLPRLSTSGRSSSLSVTPGSSLPDATTSQALPSSRARASLAE